MVQEEILRNISGTAEELKTLVEYYGTSIYEEQKRLNALLMDVIPKYERERQALMQSIENGVAVQLKGIKNQDEKSQIELICSCEKMLTDKLQWNPKKAAYCVQVIAVSLGVEVDTVKKINCPVKMEKELVKEPSQQTEKKKISPEKPRIIVESAKITELEAETGKSITKYVDGNKYTVHIHKGIKDGEWETIPLTHRNGTLNVKVQVIPNEDKKSENVVPKHVKRTGYVVLSTPWEFESRTILEEKKINVIYDLVNYEITVNKGTKDGDVISVPLRGKEIGYLDVIIRLEVPKKEQNEAFAKSSNAKGQDSNNCVKDDKETSKKELEKIIEQKPEAICLKCISYLLIFGGLFCFFGRNNLPHLNCFQEWNGVGDFWPGLWASVLFTWLCASLLYDGEGEETWGSAFNTLLFVGSSIFLMKMCTDTLCGWLESRGVAVKSTMKDTGYVFMLAVYGLVLFLAVRLGEIRVQLEMGKASVKFSNTKVKNNNCIKDDKETSKKELEKIIARKPEAICLKILFCFVIFGGLFSFMGRNTLPHLNFFMSWYSVDSGLIWMWINVLVSLVIMRMMTYEEYGEFQPFGDILIENIFAIIFFVIFSVYLMLMCTDTLFGWIDSRGFVAKSTLEESGVIFMALIYSLILGFTIRLGKIRGQMKREKGVK